MEDDESQPKRVDMANMIRTKNSDSSEDECKQRATQTPEKYNPAGNFYLHREDGQRFPFLCSFDHILIDGADKSKSKLLYLVNDETPQLVKYLSGKRMSPAATKTAT